LRPWDIKFAGKEKHRQETDDASIKRHSQGRFQSRKENFIFASPEKDGKIQEIIN
jgi:hypothetical protein